MRNVKIIVFAVLFCLSCGGNDRTVNSLPSNPAASVSASLVLGYLAYLSSDGKGRVISGQNCLHGNQICDGKGNGYSSMIGELYAQSGKYPGIIGLDYEHDKIFTSSELSEANAVLIDYWNSGGLVAVNWSPQNPWLNDESDIAADPGVWSNTRVNGSYSVNLSDVDIPKLLDPREAVFAVWRKKLDRIAGALAELRDAGVVVLWRPMQEMNGFWFWWGTASDPGNMDNYKMLYVDMYNYFTKEKKLNNLLWVYSPASSNPEIGVAGVMEQYPGKDFVDIVGGTQYGDSLAIRDYEVYRSCGKPIAMSEYGISESGVFAGDGSFDDSKYISVLSDNYPDISYWVTWHDWDTGGGIFNHMSLKSNMNSGILMNDRRVIDRFETAVFTGR